MENRTSGLVESDLDLVAELMPEEAAQAIGGVWYHTRAITFVQRFNQWEYQLPPAAASSSSSPSN
jgi:hypothetical protein